MEEMTIYPPKEAKTKCPKCGWESSKGYGVKFTMDGNSSDFCLICYHNWFEQNIPKMETVDEP